MLPGPWDALVRLLESAMPPPSAFRPRGCLVRLVLYQDWALKLAGKRWLELSLGWLGLGLDFTPGQLTSSLLGPQFPY